MPPKKRFFFKTNVKYDIALLLEVESLNPYNFADSKVVWCEISKKLSENPLSMIVTDRSCRERMEDLIAAFKKDESISQKASGVEEEDLNELRRLLTSVTSLYDCKPEKPTNKYAGQKKDREAAEKIRESALLRFEGEDDELFDADSESPTSCHKQDDSAEKNGNEKINQPPILPKNRIRKGDVLGYLHQKQEDKVTYMEKELKIREAEAENRRLELEVKKQKLTVEAEAKFQELQLRKLEQEAQIEERKVMS